MSRASHYDPLAIAALNSRLNTRPSATPPTASNTVIYTNRRGITTSRDRLDRRPQQPTGIERFKINLWAISKDDVIEHLPGIEVKGPLTVEWVQRRTKGRRSPLYLVRLRGADGTVFLYHSEKHAPTDRSISASWWLCGGPKLILANQLRGHVLQFLTPTMWVGGTTADARKLARKILGGAR